MDGHIDETRHVILVDKFEKNKRYKEQIIKEIIAAICAMLNSNGGKVVIDIESDSNDSPVGSSPSFQMSLVIRMVEQCIISIIGLHQTTSNINFREDNKSMLILVKKAYSLITNYNLYLPSHSQVVLVSPLEPFEKIKNDIINRKFILEPVQLGSHNKIFRRDRNCDIYESKTVQFKYLEAHATKRTTLADRIIGKGNKFTCYVSAFANYSGGHIYLGIIASGVVVGEVIQNEEDKKEIIKKVEKAIKKMIWPEHIGQPKQGEHWDIYFEPVVDEDNKPIPSIFVIVIYIAPCLGGVFAEEPECYEMVERKITKMSFMTWKERMLLPGWPYGREEIRSIPRITWSSAEARQSFTVEDEKFRKLISNGDWCAFLKKCEDLCKKPQSSEMLLLILSKQITASNRRGQFKKAHDLLEEYEKILPKAKDRMIFEVTKLFLEAALKRASGDLKGLIEPLKSALSMAELIEPGLVPAIVYVFAATVTDLVDSGDLATKFSPDSLSRKALEHLRWVPDSSDVRADMEQRAHMTLVTFHLGCNVSGQRIKDIIHISDLDKAKDSITALYQCFAEASPLTRYREVQHNLVLSIYKYRRSQLTLKPDEKVRYLRQAFSYAEKGERLASDLGFKEMVEWGRANKAFCAEALIRSKFKE